VRVSPSAVGVAITPDLAVGDDVKPGAFLLPDGEQCGVVLRLIAPPQLPRYLGTNFGTRLPRQSFLLKAGHVVA
jgi:hypothetical protein